MPLTISACFCVVNSINCFNRRNDLSILSNTTCGSLLTNPIFTMVLVCCIFEFYNLYVELKQLFRKDYTYLVKKSCKGTKRASTLRDITLSQCAYTLCRAEFGTQYIFQTNSCTSRGAFLLYRTHFPIKQKTRASQTVPRLEKPP